MSPANDHAQTEERFLALFEASPLPVQEMLALIRTCAATQSEDKAAGWSDMLMQELVDKQECSGLLTLFKAQAERFAGTLTPAGIRDKLKKASKDRLTLAIIDAAAFGETDVRESFRRIDLLMALTPGTLVIDAAWGFGCVKSIDDFYKRVTIDFTS